MTYKKADQLFRRWMLFYVVHCALGAMILLSGILKRDGFVFFLGLMINGSSMWSWRKMNNHRRLRRQIIEVWEKKFDDVEFLELHARHNWRFQGIHLRDSFPGMRSALWPVSKLWAGRKTSETVHLDYLVADVVRDVGAKRLEGKSEFYQCLLAGVLYGLIEPTLSEPRAFRIGQLVFRCAKEHYPLEKFEIPIESGESAAKHVLAT